MDFVIHTGDITLPKSLEKFKVLKAPLNGVFGNNDEGEKESLKKISNKFNFKFTDNPLVLDIFDRSVVVYHDPKDIDESYYDDGNIIVHGHTHRYRNEKYRNTYIFNPGECAGFMKDRNQIGIVTVDKNPKMEIIRF